MPAPEARVRVGYVLRKFPVLSETFVLNEILGLERRGVKVEIFSLAPPRDPRFHEQLSELKAAVWYVPGLAEYRTLLDASRRASRRFGAPFWAAFRRVLLTGRPDYVRRFLQAAWIAERAARLKVERFHAHFATRATTAAQLASEITGRPYSFTAHAFDIYKTNVRPQVLRDKLERAEFVVTISEANRAFLEDVSERSRERIELVRNGIDLERFRPNGEPAGTRGKAFRILSVARLVEKKGLPVLVEACRLLRDAGHDFRCEIIGRGRLRGALNAAIAAAGLEDRVRLLGGRRHGEVLDRYRESDAYVLPSIIGSDGNREGLPVSIVEALACGLPVVSTPIAGIPEVVRDGLNGMLVPPNDAPALAGALARMIVDRDAYLAMRAAARTSIADAFDAARTSRSLHQLFAGAAR